MRWYDAQIARIPEPREERDVDTAAGGRTHVVIAGPRDGEALFLVHGGGGSAAILKNEIAWFARAGLRVFAPDIPGHMGKSEVRQMAYTPDGPSGIGRWLAEVMTAVGVERASFVATSLGGVVIQQLAAHAPARIRCAVLLNAAGLTPPSVPRARRIVFARLMAAITKKAAWREKMLRAMYAPDAEPDPFTFEFGLHIIEHWIPDLRPFPLVRPEPLSRLSAPVLVVCGEQDPLFDPRKALARARRALPGATVEMMAGGGHMLNEDQLLRFRRRAMAFLREAGVVASPARSA